MLSLESLGTFLDLSEVNFGYGSNWGSLLFTIFQSFCHQQAKFSIGNFRLFLEIFKVSAGIIAKFWLMSQKYINTPWKRLVVLRSQSILSSKTLNYGTSSSQMRCIKHSTRDGLHSRCPEHKGSKISNRKYSWLERSHLISEKFIILAYL